MKIKKYVVAPRDTREGAWTVFEQSDDLGLRYEPICEAANVGRAEKIAVALMRVEEAARREV
jgi:hypothetical protein